MNCHSVPLLLGERFSFFIPSPLSLEKKVKERKKAELT